MAGPTRVFRISIFEFRISFFDLLLYSPVSGMEPS